MWPIVKKMSHFSLLLETMMLPYKKTKMPLFYSITGPKNLSQNLSFSQPNGSLFILLVGGVLHQGCWHSTPSSIQWMTLQGSGWLPGRWPSNWNLTSASIWLPLLRSDVDADLTLSAPFDALSCALWLQSKGHWNPSNGSRTSIKWESNMHQNGRTGIEMGIEMKRHKNRYWIGIKWALKHVSNGHRHGYWSGMEWASEWVSKRSSNGCDMAIWWLCHGLLCRLMGN